MSTRGVSALAKPIRDFTVTYLGREMQPVVVIDDFSSDFVSLLQRSREATYGAAGTHYPGRRALANADYLSENMETLKEILTKVFEMPGGARLVECNFSMVTTPPSDLSIIQRLPHFDGANPGKLALLHYLRGPEYGGTSFYRHRATGYETITAGRIKSYDTCLQIELEKHGAPRAAYFNESNSQFELLNRIPSKENRMVIYRGNTLHSGNILKLDRISNDANLARITLNTFLQSR